MIPAKYPIDCMVLVHCLRFGLDNVWARVVRVPPENDFEDRIIELDGYRYRIHISCIVRSR